MEVCCTRPGCPRPLNHFNDLDDSETLKTVSQKFCTTCGMPLILAGRYLPIQLLGKGGFGAAFLARDRYTPAMRQCVVKQFQPAGDLSAQQMAIAQQLFEREAAVLEELGNKHPQIPDLFAFFPLNVATRQPGQEEKFFYLVQEFIDGRNLEQELQQKGAFSEAEVLQVLEQILPILQFVHDRGSIHRDIKPSNIMRDRAGRFHLLDFGAVKQITNTPQAAGSTGIYSQGFAPPEQMAGTQVYPSTDLYALAVTCLNLLANEDPKSLFDSYNNQWNWRSRIQVSPQLAQVLDRLLLSAPNQRFQSAQEVIAALSSPPTPPPIPSPVPVPSQAPTPHPAPVAATPAQVARPHRAAFSTVEWLGIAGFTGYEAALLALVLDGWIASPGIAMGLWGGAIGLLVYAQYRRWIEKFDLTILAGISLAIAAFVFRGSPLLGRLLIVPPLVGAALIAIVALFRLIYQLIARFTQKN
ncbi:serine/threonine protein kinase [Desertifilum sp. FACHB-1129]|uniref:non-specific serine/threonine protein kinase n=1 Tax=Desertifilum tharense IPPAS B-1220 TaxID=1781255 RepID=A0A1E5QLR7_9CYAN|nr:MULTISPECIES: serine/threonine-protein kinase [Desertifilum]MDA0212005.1 serine/threonine-protein kinase [Cyanobacteria bacterium FC1]MBD2313268.1 serine/threonine protein kinase [Desertifilum sp. FACHB-1129]MBD2324271.1 serine/threonine protein kinase [Desertifilum sp. FACHB-866]MBD2334286.1 serine/threonine protein kinase [Desertifilum sp. FACHB-868]OEJ75580.1 serine/threonine protein kinase [Desertifilum tharense IPPAS B-1220]